MEYNKIGALIGLLLILGLLFFLFAPREWFDSNVLTPESNKELFNETSYNDNSYTGLIDGYFVGTFREKAEPIMEDAKIGISNYNGIIKIGEINYDFSGGLEGGYFSGRIFSGTPNNNSWTGNISGTVTNVKLNGIIRVPLIKVTQKQDSNQIYLLMLMVIILLVVFLYIYFLKQEEQKKYYVVNVPEADKITRPQLRENYDIYVRKLLRGKCYPHDKPQLVKLGYLTVDGRLCIAFLRYGEIIDVYTECSAADFKKEFDEKGIVQTFEEKNSLRGNKNDWHDKTKKSKPTSRVDDGYIVQSDEPDKE